MRGARGVVCDWGGSAVSRESTLHQLSPYIGKVKSSMAASLVAQFTKVGDFVYDPFSGSGTVALEAWFAGREVVANDLSPYAYLLTQAKLFPSRNLDFALEEIHALGAEVAMQSHEVDLRRIPVWVRRFFHTETLRETVAWSTVLKRRRRWFLLASLMGILHHQRPGFLSYPSSHAVPYLRTKKFPRYRFPKLYAYRSIQDRLEAKVMRAFRRTPELDFELQRHCFRKDAASLSLPKSVDAIITSPPYMRLLEYGRDNRLRLWFLGVRDWSQLDELVSPNEGMFLDLMGRCFTKWKTFLKPNGLCVLVIGDALSQLAKGNLPEVVAHIATSVVGGYTHVCEYRDLIPNVRRVRRGTAGSSSETIVVLRKQVGSS